MHHFNNKDSRVQQKTLLRLQQFTIKQKIEIQLFTEFGLSNLSDLFQNRSKKEEKKQRSGTFGVSSGTSQLVVFLQIVYLSGSWAAGCW